MSVSPNEVQNDIFGDVQVAPSVRAFLIEQRGSRIAEGQSEWFDWKLVGTGKVSLYSCGTYRFLDGCLNVEGHNITDLSGRSFKDKVPFKPVYHSCGEPSCPKCYRVWCLREAAKIEAKCLEVAKHWGVPDHCVISLPLKDYWLVAYPELLFKKLYGFLKELGIVAAVVIPHAFRFDGGRPYGSFHLHLLIFLDSTYKCRSCEPSKARCAGCGLFMSRAYAINERSGWIFRILDKRKSVFWTAAYQLSHCTYLASQKRHNVVRYFGVLKGLKIKVRRHKRVCPICGEEFVRIMPLHGAEDALLAPVMNFPYASFRCRIDNMFDADGSARYVVVEGLGYDRSGQYE